mgnify:CR=1 FL=1
MDLRIGVAAGPGLGLAAGLSNPGYILLGEGPVNSARLEEMCPNGEVLLQSELVAHTNVKARFKVGVGSVRGVQNLLYGQQWELRRPKKAKTDQQVANAASSGTSLECHAVYDWNNDMEPSEVCGLFTLISAGLVINSLSSRLYTFHCRSGVLVEKNSPPFPLRTWKRVCLFAFVSDCLTWYYGGFGGIVSF